MSFKISKAEAKEIAADLVEEMLSVLDEFDVKIQYDANTESHLVIEALEETFARKIKEYEN
jgi:hypothetical protein